MNPRGKLYYPDLVAALVERYGFAKFPKTPEEFDESKGIDFGGGRFGDVNVHQVQIFNTGVVVDTSSSTVDSERLLMDALPWAAEKFSLIFRPEMISRKAYVSNLTFYSDVVLNQLHPAVSKIAERLSARVPQYFGFPLQFSPSSITVGFDPMAVKAGPTPFTIEHRGDSRFSDNKWFSAAPLPTDEHIAILEEFEAGLASFNQSNKQLPIPKIS
jgi:hypothetical protein